MARKRTRTATEVLAEDPPWEACPLIFDKACVDCGGEVRRTPSGPACREHGDQTEEVVRKVTAWKRYPILVGRCPTCSGTMRGTNPPTCRNGHAGNPVDQLGRYINIAVVNIVAAQENPSAEEVAARVNAGTLPGFENAMARVTGPRAIEVVGKRTGTGARVVFHERPTTRLEQIDYDLADEVRSQVDVAGAFVKVSAALRPSEREGFDGRSLKEDLAARGARAVLLAVHPVSEAPDREAKRETATALRPEDAIAAWFDGLPVPEEDRAAAKARALEILAAEGG